MKGPWKKTAAVALSVVLAAGSMTVSAAAEQNTETQADLNIYGEWTDESVFALYTDGIALPLNMNYFTLRQDLSGPQYVYLENVLEDGSIGQFLLLETMERGEVTAEDFSSADPSYLASLIEGDSWYPGTMQTEAAELEAAGYRALEAGYTWTDQGGTEYQLCRCIIDSENGVISLLYGLPSVTVTEVIEWTNDIISYMYPVYATEENAAEASGGGEENADTEPTASAVSF